MEWLNYHHLLYFWLVAREGGLAPAGKILRLSQPTLSEQIRKLEEALGERLFERHGRKLQLTEMGRVVQRYADEIFTTGNENNRTGWSNPAFDTLIAAAEAAAPGARRNELLAQAEALLLEELPVLPVYSYVTQNLVNPRLGGGADVNLTLEATFAEPSPESRYSFPSIKSDFHLQWVFNNAAPNDAVTGGDAAQQVLIAAARGHPAHRDRHGRLPSTGFRCGLPSTPPRSAHRVKPIGDEVQETGRPWKGSKGTGGGIEGVTVRATRRRARRGWV